MFNYLPAFLVLCPQKQPVASLEEIFEKIRGVVFKNGIRTTEFFRDHDKLRSGVITENQVNFLSVCSLIPRPLLDPGSMVWARDYQ